MTGFALVARGHRRATTWLLRDRGVGDVAEGEVVVRTERGRVAAMVFEAVAAVALG